MYQIPCTYGTCLILYKYIFFLYICRILVVFFFFFCYSLNLISCISSFCLLKFFIFLFFFMNFPSKHFSRDLPVLLFYCSFCVLFLYGFLPSISCISCSVYFLSYVFPVPCISSTECRPWPPWINRDCLPNTSPHYYILREGCKKNPPFYPN